MARSPRRNRPPHIDPETWQPPAIPLVRDPKHLPGTRSGSRLYEQPAHRKEADRIRQFCASASVLNIEVGVDRGYRLLSHARRWPDEHWLGIELRRSVEHGDAELPTNALLVRGDARAVLAHLVPPRQVTRVDILFPTPSDNPRHLLLTPAFAALLHSVLKVGGVVHIATDIPGMVALVEDAFGQWAPAPTPPSGPVRSRREKACERSDCRVWRWTFTPAIGSAQLGV